MFIQWIPAIFIGNQRLNIMDQINIQLEDTMVYLNRCISSCWTTSGESHVFDGAEPSEK